MKHIRIIGLNLYALIVVVGQAALAAALARDLDLSAYSLCGMYPDIETSNTATMIVDGVVAPKKMYDDGSEGSFVGEGGQACKCGANCKCDPCTC
ncbi:metallothionein-like protein 1 [Tanacetum coccineum]